MFLNRTVLITAFTLFITTGCVNVQNEAQQMQITNLQNELLKEQETHQQTQSELTNTQKTLQTSQNKAVELTNLLANAQQEKTQLEKTRQDKVKKVIKLDDKTILGQTEWVYVSTAKSNYKGRIDTGAATSSLNAVNLERFERDGKKWVRFNLSHEKGLDPQIIEAKIERFVKILQSSKPGVTTERPVIKLHLRIGDIAHLTEFTLTDRTHMEYPVLIGRSFMRDVVLVDVSKEYIHSKYKTIEKQ